MKHVQIETVAIKGNSELNEAWIQGVIAENPKILGLGDLVLRDKERRQPHGGRLDLLLQDRDSGKRYEVEVQLGPTDESHIIRTIEYWDVEKKRYPQYEHCAVIVAETITSRLLNIISLFNGAIPLIALQMTAIKLDGGIGLTFTKVMDERSLGLVDEDEDISVVTDRAYWEKNAPKHIMAMLDQLLEMVHEIDPGFSFKYNKFYIGMAKDGVTNNFIWCEPRKSNLQLNVRLPKEEKLSTQLDESGLDLLDYKWDSYRLRLTANDLAKHKELVKNLIKTSYSAQC